MDIWLHVGFGKTGTSAVQVALARGRERLAECGLFYPPSLERKHDDRSVGGGITSGNAIAIGHLMCPGQRPGDFDATAAWSWLERVLAEAGERTLLLSSETMVWATAANAGPVLDLLRRRGRRVRVLCHVRHALEWTVARYAQRLKNPANAMPDDLETLLANTTVPFEWKLKAWAAVVGRDAITCRLYDEDREALVTRILEVVHPPAAALGPELAASTPLVNRSPTPTELRLLRRLRLEADAEDLCRVFRHRVLNTPAAVAEEFVVPEAVFAAFQARNQPILDAVNRTWLLPAGRRPVQASAGRIRIGDTGGVDAARSEAILAACFINAVRRPPAGRC